MLRPRLLSESNNYSTAQCPTQNQTNAPILSGLIAKDGEYEASPIEQIRGQERIVAATLSHAQSIPFILLSC